MRKLNSKGFTIIELLVVIVIIGILVALALPNLFSAQQRGRDTERKNDLKNISQKLETYYNDNTKYPVGDLAAVATTLDLSDDDVKDPKNSGDYVYSYTGEDCDTDGCQAYTLSAELENDKDSSIVSGTTRTYEVKSVNQPSTTEED